MPLNYNVFSQSEPVPVFDPVADDLRRQQAQAGQFKLRDYQEQRQREQSLRPALADYAGGNRARLADIMAIDPERGIQLQGVEAQQQAAAQTEQRARALDLARILDGTKTFDELNARRRIATRLGYTDDELDDLPDSADQFDPNYFTQISNVLNNTAIGKDGRSVTQERGTINYTTDEDIRQEADKQRSLDERERFTQGAQDRRSAASNSVTMRGQDMTDKREREAQGAPGMLSPKEARRTAIQLRQQFDALPEVKAFKDIAPVIMSARRAPDTPAGDIQLAYTVGKILDPGSVVREGELAMVAKAGSPIERIIGSGRFVAGEGGRLTKNQRNDLLQMLNERALTNRQAYDAARDNYKGYANDSGIPDRVVVGTHPATAMGSATQRGTGRPAAATPPAAAIAALRSGKGTAAQFDAIFGAGAAARYGKGR